MGDKPTDKQIEILKKHGKYAATKQEATKIIGELFAKNDETAKPTYEAKVPSHGNNTSFKVAYAKDLLIAMIEHAATTGNKEFDVLQASQLAEQIIGAMWHVFSDQ